MFRRPERADIKTEPFQTDRGYQPRSAFLFLAILLISTLLVSTPSPVQAQAAGARKAIEKLEGCSKEERKQGCVNILKREKRNGNIQAVKAQVRGGRIIWYEYDKKSGKARRTN